MKKTNHWHEMDRSSDEEKLQHLIDFNGRNCPWRCSTCPLGLELCNKVCDDHPGVEDAIIDDKIANIAAGKLADIHLRKTLNNEQN